MKYPSPYHASPKPQERGISKHHDCIALIREINAEIKKSRKRSYINDLIALKKEVIDVCFGD